MEHTLEMLFRHCYLFLYYFVLNSLNCEGLGAGTEHATGVREAELCLNSTWEPKMQWSLLLSLAWSVWKQPAEPTKLSQQNPLSSALEKKHFSQE